MPVSSRLPALGSRRCPDHGDHRPAEVARDFTSGPVYTYDVTYTAGSEPHRVTLVTKTAWHNERAVLALLTWDQTRYGPWYFDLPLLFTKRTVLTYHAALQAAGVPLDAATFAANFDAAWSFVGFKYLIPPLEAWLRGERRQQRREIKILLNRALATQAPG